MGSAAKFVLSQEELNEIAAIASEKAVEAYRKEQQKAEKKKAKNEDKVKRTRKLLSSYRRLKASLSETDEICEEDKIELRWKFIEDLMSPGEVMKKSENVIVDKEKKRQENLYCVHCIENAVKLYEEECSKTSSEEGKRRYREMYAMYIDDEVLTVPEIAEKENVSEKTVYRDLGVSCSIIAVYLLGM